jgi:hypothetical protein
MRYDEDMLVVVEDNNNSQEEDVDINGILATAEIKKQQVEKRRRIEDILVEKEIQKIYGDPLLEEE